eukprot:1480347-Rhodomonas_salina.4
MLDLAAARDTLEPAEEFKPRWTSAQIPQPHALSTLQPLPQSGFLDSRSRSGATQPTTLWPASAGSHRPGNTHGDSAKEVTRRESQAQARSLKRTDLSQCLLHPFDARPVLIKPPPGRVPTCVIKKGSSTAEPDIAQKQQKSTVGRLPAGDSLSILGGRRHRDPAATEA